MAEVKPISLSGLARQSFCCSAPVEHAFQAKRRPLNRVLALKCAKCGKPADAFEVINANGDRIWPVPPNFRVPVNWKPRFPSIFAPIHSILAPKRKKTTVND